MTTCCDVAVSYNEVCLSLVARQRTTTKCSSSAKARCYLRLMTDLYCFRSVSSNSSSSKRVHLIRHSADHVSASCLLLSLCSHLRFKLSALLPNVVLFYRKVMTNFCWLHINVLEIFLIMGNVFYLPFSVANN